MDLDVLLRCDVLVLFETPHKIAAVIKPALKCHFRNGVLIGLQQRAGFVDAKGVEIVNGGAVDHFPKQSAEVFWRHSGDPGEVLQSDVLLVMGVDILQSGFQPEDFLVMDVAAHRRAEEIFLQNAAVETQKPG